MGSSGLLPAVSHDGIGDVGYTAGEMASIEAMIDGGFKHYQYLGPSIVAMVGAQSSQTTTTSANVQQQSKPPRVSIQVTQEPQVVVDEQLPGGGYLTGIAAQLMIQFIDSKGRPISGASVTETIIERGGVQNTATLTTSSNGTIKDWVGKGVVLPNPGGLEKAGVSVNSLREAANTTPTTARSTQVLTLTVGNRSFQATWTRTFTNQSANGKLRTSRNSHGVNYTIRWTRPVMKLVP